MPKISPHSILVVDNETELASLFKEFLIKEGYAVVSFTDSILAFEYYEKRGIDIP